MTHMRPVATEQDTKLTGERQRLFEFIVSNHRGPAKCCRLRAEIFGQCGREDSQNVERI